MIYGIGTDLVAQQRIRACLDRFGERFMLRVLTERERLQFAAKLRNPEQRVRFVAQRFAAKEAFSKALGTGMADGVAWRDIGVHNLPSGKPVLHTSEKLGYRLAAEGVEAMHVSLSDEAGMTVAVVVLETGNAQ